MINAIQLALISIIVLFGILKYCMIDIHRNRILKKLKHFKIADGTVINCWKTEPKGDIPMYKFACSFTDINGENKIVSVRENYDGKQYYGYRTESEKKIGSKAKIIYNSKNSDEAYIYEDLDSEKDSFRVDYMLTLVLTVVGVMIVVFVGGWIKSKFGV